MQLQKLVYDLIYFTCVVPMSFNSFYQPSWCDIKFWNRIQSCCRRHSWIFAGSSSSGNSLYCADVPL